MTSTPDWGKRAEELLELALSEVRDGLDAIPTASAAIAALKIEAGELPEDELDDGGTSDDAPSGRVVIQQREQDFEYATFIEGSDGLVKYASEQEAREAMATDSLLQLMRRRSGSIWWSGAR